MSSQRVLADPRCGSTCPRASRACSRRCARRAAGRYLVGGAVRDALLELPLEDWDVEVFGLPAERLEPVLAAHGRVDAVGQAFRVFKLAGRRGCARARSTSRSRAATPRSVPGTAASR